MTAPLKVGDLVQIVIAGAHITYVRDQIVQLRTAGGHTYVFDLPTPGITVGLMTSGVCAGSPYRSPPDGAAPIAAALPVSRGEAGHGPGTQTAKGSSAEASAAPAAADDPTVGSGGPTVRSVPVASGHGPGTPDDWPEAMS